MFGYQRRQFKTYPGIFLFFLLLLTRYDSRRKYLIFLCIFWEPKMVYRTYIIQCVCNFDIESLRKDHNIIAVIYGQIKNKNSNSFRCKEDVTAIINFCFCIFFHQQHQVRNRNELISLSLCFFNYHKRVTMSFQIQFSEQTKKWNIQIITLKFLEVCN